MDFTDETEQITNRRNNEEMKFEDKGSEIQPSNNPKLIKVLAQELIGKFRSKSDLYNYLRFKHKLFLPTFGEAKIDYIRDLLSGKKKVLLAKEVVSSEVPRYEEISVKKLWPIVQQNAEIMQYFSHYAKNKTPSSRFFFRVLAATKPEFLSESFNEVLDKRNTAKVAEDNEEYIEMTANVYDAIMTDNWITKSRGKGVYLLKKKAKAVCKQKKQTNPKLSERVIKMLNTD